MMLIPVRPGASVVCSQRKSGASKQGAEFSGSAFLSEAEHQHVQVHQHRARLIDWRVGNDCFDQHEAGVITHGAPAGPENADSIVVVPVVDDA